MRMGKQVEFEPPSDFVDAGGSGGGSKKLLKVLGIGCAGLLLIVGIVTAVGVVQGVSCCKDLTSAGEQMIGAVTYGSEFVANVQSSQFKEAHEMLGANLKGQMSVEDLRGKYDRPWLHGATLINEGIEGGSQNIQSVDDMKNLKTWDMRFRLYPQRGDTQLVSKVGVELLEPPNDEEGVPAQFAIYMLDVEERQIDFKAEPPAQAVLRLHGRLQAGDFNQAFRQMKTQSEQGGMASFKAFIEEHGELFTKGMMDIKEVRYPLPVSAIVTATISGEDQKKTSVTYTLEPGFAAGTWVIDAISPELDVKASPTEVDEAATEGGEKNQPEGERVKEGEGEGND